MDAKCRWCSNQLDGAVRFREPLGQMKVMQTSQGETLNHQGAITHEDCCIAATLLLIFCMQVIITRRLYISILVANLVYLRGFFS